MRLVQCICSPLRTNKSIVVVRQAKEDLGAPSLEQAVGGGKATPELTPGGALLHVTGGHADLRTCSVPRVCESNWIPKRASACARALVALASFPYARSAALLAELRSAAMPGEADGSDTAARGEQASPCAAAATAMKRPILLRPNVPLFTGSFLAHAAASSTATAQAPTREAGGDGGGNAGRAGSERGLDGLCATPDAHPAHAPGGPLHHLRIRCVGRCTAATESMAALQVRCMCYAVLLDVATPAPWLAECARRRTACGLPSGNALPS